MSTTVPGGAGTAPAPALTIVRRTFAGVALMTTCGDPLAPGDRIAVRLTVRELPGPCAGPVSLPGGAGVVAGPIRVSPRCVAAKSRAMWREIGQFAATKQRIHGT